MKKITLIIVVLMCVSISITAYAQGELEADILAPDIPATVENAESVVEVDNIVISESENTPRLSDGESGRGTIETPDKYWAENGYPDNISFAYETGGEMLEDGASITYWEIGIINADETSKQEILDLLSPKCLIHSEIAHIHTNNVKRLIMRFTQALMTLFVMFGCYSIQKWFL